LLAGNAYLGARNWPAAIEALESLRERLGDRDAAMLSNLAFAYSQQGDLESAVPLARKAWSLDKSNPATADLLGWLLVRSGKKPEGLALLELAARTARKEAAMPAPVPAPAPAVAPVTAAPAPAPAP
jgi:tetratricopeptide (TPR) repeat protein